MPHWVMRAGALALIMLVAALPLGIAWLVTAQQAAHKSLSFQDDVTAYIVNKLDQSFDTTILAVIGLDPLAATTPCSAELRNQLDTIIQRNSAIRELRLVKPDRSLVCGARTAAWDMGAEAISLNGKSALLYPGFSAVLDRQAFIIHLHLSSQFIAEAVIALDNSLLEALPAPLNALVEVAIVAPDGKPLFKDDRARFTIRNYGNLSDRSEHETVLLRSGRFPYAVRTVMNPAGLQLFFQPISHLPLYLAGLLSLCLFVVLIRNYDHAYYQQKESILDKRRDAFELAIENREFIPYYQPIIDLQSGRMVGAEVLMRWRKADGRIISPLAFLEEIEDEGYARRVTTILMQQVLAECGTSYAAHPHMRLSFNLFAAQFEQFTLVDDVVAVFAGQKIAYDQLIFEITEHRPLPDLAHAQRVVVEMQKLGCKIALDDVGIGASSLLTLQELGIDQLKIDKQFVETIRRVDASSPIVDGLVQMGKKLKIEIVAEGIETQVQLRNLRNRGVHLVQGNLLSPALPAGDFLALMEAMDQTSPIKQPHWLAHMAL